MGFDSDGAGNQSSNGENESFLAWHTCMQHCHLLFTFCHIDHHPIQRYVTRIPLTFSMPARKERRYATTLKIDYKNDRLAWIPKELDSTLRASIKMERQLAVPTGIPV
jgi:hypothetical protein